MSAQVISIVSGKGGSGKTLLTAVLGRALAKEDQRVLLVDMDIFVRGLTVLLHFFRRHPPHSGAITISDAFGVFKADSQQQRPVHVVRGELALQRFGECDVIPAVDEVSAPLDYDDTALSKEQFCNERVRGILDQVKDEYDFILLDNRAGMDSLVAASCRQSDFVLSVAEDDNVGRQTNANLVNYLRYTKKIKRVYSIVNKGRQIQTYRDVKSRAAQPGEYSIVGVVPFDRDIMENFGSDRFWVTVQETLYFRAIIDAWNAIPGRRSVEISESRYRFPPRIFMSEHQGRYTLLERMLRAYSVVFVLAGVSFWFYSKYRGSTIDSSDVILATSVVIGIGTTLLSTSSRTRQFLEKLVDRQPVESAESSESEP